jgi:hypothetical protein
MATSEPKPIRAPEPPRDLASRTLPAGSLPQRSWWRLHNTARPGALFWSRLGVFRFDSPGAPWGVSYFGSSVATAFLEVFGDRIRTNPRISLELIRQYQIVEVQPAADARVVALEGVAVARIGATLNCFCGSYPLSQRWGAALMAHPAQIDGLVYLGRRSGARCLALFGDETKPKPHQHRLRTTEHGPLENSLEFWQLADQLKLGVH